MEYETANSIFLYNPEIGIIYRKKNGKAVGFICSDGYIKIYYKDKYISAHRLAYLLYYKESPNQIDHINHVRSDNRIVNLRNANCKINSMNLSKFKNNTSGVTGVRFHKKMDKWVAQIKINRIFRHIGSYAEWFDAVCARKSMEYKLGFHKNHGK